MDVNHYKLRVGLISAIVLVSGSLGFSKMRSPSFWNSRDPADWVTVLVAGRYIPAFTVIRSQDIETKEFPKDLVPPGSLRAIHALVNEHAQARYVSTIAIPKEHPVTQALLVDASREDVLGSLIRPGYVAVSFEIERARGVGGWVKPGDSVALFGSHDRFKSRLLFPSLLVLAVDGVRMGDTKTPKEQNVADPLSSSPMLATTETNVLTVLATLSEATAINRAREEGSLSVVLRAPGDDIPWPKEK
jgi:Flp pilus assembly protein CpaB